MKRADEPNPALGWRAIRVGLDRPRHHADAGAGADPRRQGPAAARSCSPSSPTPASSRRRASSSCDELARERRLGHTVPAELKIGAMLETPSLAFAPDRFFELADFVSIGGNDLKQFFFAADRENELVRRRYDMLLVELPRLPRADRRPLRRARHAALLLRRGRRPPGRGAGARRHRLSQPLDAPGVDRPGQGTAAQGRPRRRPRRHRRRPPRRPAQRPPGARGLAGRDGHSPLSPRAPESRE